MKKFPALKRQIDTPMDKEKDSAKLVYSLDQVSRIAKIEPKTIENWEKEFYFLHAGRTASGKKIFRKKDLAILIRLKELVETQGVTLAGAKRRIEQEFGILQTTSVHPDRLKKVLIQIREDLKEISVTLAKK